MLRMFNTRSSIIWGFIFAPVLIMIALVSWIVNVHFIFWDCIERWISTDG